MPFSPFTRLYRRVRRLLVHYREGLAVAVHGNRIARRTDFARGEVSRPVLLLPGFGSTRRSLVVLEKRLRADGFDVFSIRIGGAFGTLNTRRIEPIARDVQRKIRSLRARFQLGRIAIVGHSKGGLIGRYVVSCLAGADDIHTLITLGTPHQGFSREQVVRITPLAFAMPSVRQMRSTSRFFVALAAAPVPAAVTCVSIASPNDRVAPLSCCQWQAPHGEATPLNIEVAGLTHTDYLIKRRAYEMIRMYLGNRD